jgi:hypothetical protein
VRAPLLAETGSSQRWYGLQANESLTRDGFLLPMQIILHGGFFLAGLLLFFSRFSRMNEHSMKSFCGGDSGSDTFP